MAVLSHIFDLSRGGLVISASSMANLIFRLGGKFAQARSVAFNTNSGFLLKQYKSGQNNGVKWLGPI
jgi:hypothetical protein